MKITVAARITGLLALLLASALAQATIINGGVISGATGAGFYKLTLPFFPPSGPANTVGNDTFQTPNLYGFDEDQNVTTVGSLSYDLAVGGSAGFSGATQNPGTLADGTVVASHYIFFDPGPSTHVRGFVEFDSDIVAVIIRTGTLAASDYLANTGVTYLNPGARGLELGSDKILSVASRRIDLDFNASTPGDYIRVLTRYSPGADLPEPASLILLGMGLLGLSLGRRRTS